MARTNSTTLIGWRQPPPRQTPRLRLKPKALPTGFVDGGWWPRGTDLPAELPDLLAVLSIRLGAIQDVIYRLGEWDKAPAKICVANRSIRLSGFRRQPPNTIEVFGVSGTAIVLLIVSPFVKPDYAHDILMTAATPDNASTTANLLAVIKS